jgi:hypothetical protein
MTPSLNVVATMSKQVRILFSQAHEVGFVLSLSYTYFDYEELKESEANINKRDRQQNTRAER